MYSSALDTVRKTDEKQLLTVEAVLMRSALSGDPAVLSPNQAVDSAAIQAIVLGNENQDKNYFLEAVKLGIIRVSIPEGSTSIIDYFDKLFLRNSNNSTNAFIFSSLPFLYYDDVDEQGRSEVFKYICSYLHEYRLRTRSASVPSWLSSSDKEIVERFATSIIRLDSAVQLYDTYSNCRELLPDILFKLLSQRLLVEKPNTALSELIKKMLDECNRPDRSYYRSYYYRICDSYKPDFGAEAVKEVKEIIDICYNKLTSLSLNTGAELNIDSSLYLLAETQIKNDSVKYSGVSFSSVPETDLEKLDWYSIVEIYRSVDEICRNKGYSWKEALELYYHMQQRLPFILGGKTFLITSITMAVSSIPIVGTILSNPVSEFIWNLFCDEVGDVIQKPSAKEIFKQTKNANHNRKVMDIVVFSENKPKR